MNVNAQSSVSLLESVLAAQSTRVDMAVSVLKRAQDVEQRQGEAMVEVIEAAGAPAAAPVGLDAYA